MKWFKHETDAISSEKIAKLISEFGFEGYGRYWRIMEIIAERMDKSPRCGVELPITDWLRYLSIRRPLFTRYLSVISQLFNIKVITTTQLIYIEIPNLLIKRDNYTKDLEASCKKLPSKEVEVEVEVEVEKNKDIDIYSRPDTNNKIENEKNEKKKNKPSSRTPLSPEDFLKAIKTNPAYQGIDIDRELSKMDLWFLTPNGHGRKKTHKFILNWLNKCEREISKTAQEIIPYDGIAHLKRLKEKNSGQ